MQIEKDDILLKNENGIRTIYLSGVCFKIVFIKHFSKIKQLNQTLQSSQNPNNEGNVL
jgi:hypothetical protein